MLFRVCLLVACCGALATAGPGALKNIYCVRSFESGLQRLPIERDQQRISIISVAVYHNQLRVTERKRDLRKGGVIN